MFSKFLYILLLAIKKGPGVVNLQFDSEWLQD